MPPKRKIGAADSAAGNDPGADPPPPKRGRFDSLPPTNMRTRGAASRETSTSASISAPVTVTSSATASASASVTGGSRQASITEPNEDRAALSSEAGQLKEQSEVPAVKRKRSTKEDGTASSSEAGQLIEQSEVPAVKRKRSTKEDETEDPKRPRLDNHPSSGTTVLSTKQSEAPADTQEQSTKEVEDTNAEAVGSNTEPRPEQVSDRGGTSGRGRGRGRGRVKGSGRGRGNAQSIQHPEAPPGNQEQSRKEGEVLATAAPESNNESTAEQASGRGGTSGRGRGRGRGRGSGRGEGNAQSIQHPEAPPGNQEQSRKEGEVLATAVPESNNESTAEQASGRGGITGRAKGRGRGRARGRGVAQVRESRGTARDRGEAKVRAEVGDGEEAKGSGGGHGEKVQLLLESDPSLAADLQRQAELKKAYKSIEKNLRTALLEMADRTEHSIDNDPLAHTKCGNYKVVQAQLDARLAESLSRQEQVRRITLEYEERKYEMEVELINMRCQSELADKQELYEALVKYDFMKQVNSNGDEQDGNETDEEDDLLPPIRKDGSLRPQNSRSRFLMEVERRWQELEARLGISEEIAAEDVPTLSDSGRATVTTFDSNLRQGATATHNIDTIAQASTMVPAPPQNIRPAPAATTGTGFDRMQTLAEVASTAPRESSNPKRKTLSELIAPPPGAQSVGAVIARMKSEKKVRQPGDPVTSRKRFGKQSSAPPIQSAPPVQERTLPPLAAKPSLSPADSVAPSTAISGSGLQIGSMGPPTLAQRPSGYYPVPPPPPYYGHNIQQPITGPPSQTLGSSPADYMGFEQGHPPHQPDYGLQPRPMQMQSMPSQTPSSPFNYTNVPESATRLPPYNPRSAYPGRAPNPATNNIGIAPPPPSAGQRQLRPQPTYPPTTYPHLQAYPHPQQGFKQQQQYTSPFGGAVQQQQQGAWYPNPYQQQPPQQLPQPPLPPPPQQGPQQRGPMPPPPPGPYDPNYHYRQQR
ncbi:MAG: hypothetical protein M1812_002329 [Candelaria pacifica]|nr:MAG: hypothetical protein M1812_002329 [Candelaria pacifica]